jgi:hypothetical protein
MPAASPPPKPPIVLYAAPRSERKASPASVTLDIEDYTCELIDKAGKAFKLRYRKGGEQGYRININNTYPGDTAILRTAPTYKILEDSSGRLRGYEYSAQRKIKNWARFGENRTFIGPGQGEAVLVLERSEYTKPKKTQMHIHKFKAGSQEDTYSGPCLVKWIPQGPASRRANGAPR